MTTNFASFKLRLLAWFIDLNINLLIIVAVLLYLSQSQSLIELWQKFVYYLVLWGIPGMFVFLFFNCWLTIQFGGSIGKLLTGLKIVATEHSSLTYKKLLFRYISGYQFSSLMFGLGYLYIIKDPKKQAWHDKAVGTYVLVAKPLWPLALLIAFLLLCLNIYLSSTAITNFTKDPLTKEFTNLQDLFIQQQKNIQQQKDSTPSPSLKPVNEPDNNAVNIDKQNINSKPLKTI